MSAGTPFEAMFDLADILQRATNAAVQPMELRHDVYTLTLDAVSGANLRPGAPVYDAIVDALQASLEEPTA